jgi:signal transduction histidine kinase
MQRFLLTIFIAFLSLCPQLLSQGQIVYTGEEPLLPVSSYILLYEDTSGKVNVTDILENDFTFKKHRKYIPAYSFTRSAIWFRFSLENKQNQQVYLEISPPILNDICLYEITDNRVTGTFQSGNLYSNHNQNAFKSNNFIFTLNPNADSYLVRIKTKTRLFITAQIGNYQAMLDQSVRTNAIHGLYAGLLIVIFIYNLFLFISTRESIYFYYLLHLINTSVFFILMSGFGFAYIWPDYPFINSNIVAIISLFYILTFLFIIKFLELPKSMPVLYGFFIFVILVLVFIGLMDFSGYHILSGKLLNYLGLAGIIPIIFGSMILIKQGNKPAIIFLFAWILYMIGVSIQTLQGLNYIPTNSFTSNSIQLGSALEIILLSIAVGNRIKSYKHEIERAGIRTQEHQREKEELIKNQHIELENRYQFQTEQLYEKIKELKRQTKEINNQYEEISAHDSKISKINALLEENNRIITRQNAELLANKQDLERIVAERTSELETATRIAEEADEEKTAFLKDFSHELRTPMNAIAGFASLMLDIESDDKSFDYYSGIIVDNTDNLLDLIDNIIDLSKLQSGELNLKKVRFDPAKLCNAIHDKYKQKLRKDKKSFVDLMLDIPDDKSLRLYLDYNRFWKIISQLVDNSVKYTETGYIKFGYKQIAENNSVEIFVIDTGVGIKKEKLNYVFENFSKLQRSKLKFHPGTGLGLSLVKGLTRLMDGDIAIQTITLEDNAEQNTGTCIKVLIPNAFI